MFQIRCIVYYTEVLIFYVKAIRSLGIGDILKFPIYFDVISIVVKRPYAQAGFNVRYWLHCQSFLLELESF